MKLSSQATVLCTVLVAVATLNVVDASDRKLIRKRNLIKVNTGEQDSRASETEFDEFVEIDDTKVARLMMEMSMSMSVQTGDGSSDGSSDNSSDRSSDGDGGDVAPSSASVPTSEQPPSRAADTGVTDEAPATAPTPFIAPSGEVLDPSGEDSVSQEESSASIRSMAITAVATTVMVVPLLL